MHTLVLGASGVASTTSTLMRRILSVTFALATFMIEPPRLEAQQWSEVEQEVWAVVERGWDALRSEDVDRFMSTFHPQFLGWNTSREKPYDLAAERSGTEAFLDRYDWESYQIKPLAIRVVRDVAVVHYQYREVVRETGGNGLHDETGRATQVLKLEQGQWKTLTTMSGPVPPQ